MDLLESLLGRSGGRRRSSGGGIFDLIAKFSRWIIGCGCILILVIVGGIVLLLAGTIKLGDSALIVIVVVGTLLVAIASLVRSGLADRQR